ncbi:glycosyltransferase family 2 protein [Mycobacterium sp. E3198]|uniref:glycosyltransferase family 2 protein n=1 Tax=Mycobacterium sp. E3198 TaxID=1834143 RepID=UPI0012E9BCA2|nr:hypothetical protein [Mycobacterium sp. E3198]
MKSELPQQRPITWRYLGSKMVIRPASPYKFILDQPVEDVGFYESLAIASNDVDLCLRLSQTGYRNVWTPTPAQTPHRLSVADSRGNVPPCERGGGDMLPNDRYYHPALSLANATSSRIPVPLLRKHPDDRTL